MTDRLDAICVLTLKIYDARRTSPHHDSLTSLNIKQLSFRIISTLSRLKFHALRHFPWEENNEDNEVISKLDFFNSKIYINAKKVYVEGRPHCPVQNNWNGILTLTLTFYKERNKTTLKKIRSAVLKENSAPWIHHNESDMLILTSFFFW